MQGGLAYASGYKTERADLRHRNPTCQLPLLGFESDVGFGADEVISANGDSGAPSFLNGAIAAVTAFGGRLPSTDVTDDLDSSWGELGFDTRVSVFREFIEEATGGAALFVTDGDYDKYGAADERDYQLWRAQYGTTDFLAADGNGDGVVSAADYTLWRDNLPQEAMTAAAMQTVPGPQAQFQVNTATLTSAQATIPEPAT